MDKRLATLDAEGEQPEDDENLEPKDDQAWVSNKLRTALAGPKVTRLRLALEELAREEEKEEEEEKEVRKEIEAQYEESDPESDSSSEDESSMDDEDSVKEEDIDPTALPSRGEAPKMPYNDSWRAIPSRKASSHISADR